MIQNLYWKRIFQSPKTKIGLIVVMIFAVAAVFAPVLAPHDPLLVARADRVIDIHDGRIREPAEPAEPGEPAGPETRRSRRLARAVETEPRS